MDTNGVKQLMISVPNPKTKKASGSIDSTITEVTADIYRVLCDYAGLGTDAYGTKHTTYSLRHSALCFQTLRELQRQAPGRDARR